MYQRFGVFKQTRMGIQPDQNMQMLLLSELYEHMPKTTRDVVWETKSSFDGKTALPELESALMEKVNGMYLPYEQVTCSLIATFLPYIE